MSKIPNEELRAVFPNMPLYQLGGINREALVYMGANARETLVLSTVTDSESVSFLTKILSAVKYDLQNDVAFIDQTKQSEISYRELKNCLPFDKLISFGCDSKMLGIHLDCHLYEPIVWNQTKLLFAEDLETIAADQKKKAKLWKALQAFFEI